MIGKELNMGMTILCRRKDGDWYLYSEFLVQENSNNALKNVQKSAKAFKPNMPNVVSTGTSIAKYGFSCTLWAVQGSHGIVVKCTAAIFFPMEDWKAPFFIIFLDSFLPLSQNNAKHLGICSELFFTTTTFLYESAATHSLEIMHLSMVCSRMGGGGNPREFDFARLYLGRDFDVHSDPLPLGGKFDSVAILESGEGLGASGHLGKSPEVIWMSFPRFCCALHNGRTEGKDYLDASKVKIVVFNTHPFSILKFCNT